MSELGLFQRNNAGILVRNNKIFLAGNQGGVTADDLYNALQYSGLVTPDMSEEEMLEALANCFPMWNGILVNGAAIKKGTSNGTGYFNGANNMGGTTQLSNAGSSFSYSLNFMPAFQRYGYKVCTISITVGTNANDGVTFNHTFTAYFKNASGNTLKSQSASKSISGSNQSATFSFAIDISGIPENEDIVFSIVDSISATGSHGSYHYGKINSVIFSK